jgi:hydrogenase-4 component E
MVLTTNDVITGMAALLAIWMCGIVRVPVMLRGLAAQTALLAVATMVLSVELGAPHYMVLGVVVLVVKAIAIPVYLAWAARRLGIQRDGGVMLSPAFTLLIGLGLLVAGYILAPRFAVPTLGHSGCAGVALTLVLIGMLLMLTRRLALSQVIGFLVMENGIFVYSLTQTSGMPMIIEMGVVFDVLVAVLVAGLVIFRLNRSFEHIDVKQLRGLRY